ncbi:class II fructose-bisphosphatase [Alkalihalobacillus sp. BA299]|uniref:class II fructose-bisphosphatase n=1 Tax=Alkalihalobacillus sp. BA299 TaxID=2815938 RepID=UPI001ADC12E7|nr:class II fructose-bisphosphatase [Alkalihalobacillus sp. BA299]
MNNLLLDFIHVSESAALAAYPWIGKGNKNEADGASTKAMRAKLNQISMDGQIVIGEGELDEAPMLYIGEKVGTGKGPSLDLAVDPIDGTELIAKGQGNSIVVIAGSIKGSLLHAPDMYMEKIAVGPKGAGKIDLDAPLFENMKAVAQANGKSIQELNIIVQDRERHLNIINEVRRLGASVTLFNDVDVTAGIATALNNLDIDLFLGIGGAPEGVVTAVALKCLGGDFQARLLPNNEAEFQRCKRMGISNVNKKLNLKEIVKSEDCFFVATGITDGYLLNGVSTNQHGQLSTHSFTTYGNSGRYHFIQSTHELLQTIS